MSKTLFIADLHLHRDRTDITDLFCHFLRHDAIGCDALYILGDLFEVWFGDDNPCPMIKHVSERLKELNDTGVPIYYIHGNRDFTIGKRFCKQSGMILLPEHKVVDLYGTPALIMHGDSLCTRDVAYQKFRKRSRNPIVKFLLLSLPFAMRKKIAGDIRSKSKSSNKQLTLEIMDVTQSEVEKDMTDNGVQLLIHGHTHRPDRHHFELNGKPAERIVLGDWYEQGSSLVVTPDGMSLENQAFISPKVED
ncbi:MAG: UDP-2,3-diacylglucosamine diphosphatase [Psychrobium sp.]